jgi:hypothetical protein
MGNAAVFGLIVKTLVNDSALKTLMNIPVSEQTDYTLLVKKYFLQTDISDEFTDDGLCRLLIRRGAQRDTGSVYIKFDNLIIEIYVPKSKDFMSGFQSKIIQIADQLQTLLNHQTFSDRKLIFANAYEMPSGSKFFKRYNVRFEFKNIYK